MAGLIVGCGGGGGSSGSDTAAFRTPPEARISDIVPQDVLSDYRNRNYFPLNAGDTWVYDVQSTGQPDSTITVTVVSGPDTQGQALVRETSSTGSIDISYRRTALGLTFNPLAGTAPAGVRQLIGDLLAYPEQVYLLNAERVSERAGPWDRDEDGDGHPEGFTLAYRSRLLGLDTLPMGRGSLQTLNQRTSYTFSLTPSNPGLANTTTSGDETVWAAPGLGIVKATRIVEGVPAIRAPQNLTLREARIGGKVLPRDDDAVTRTVPLIHTSLVFDATRQVYYASVPARVAGNGNRIATIDALSGAVSYSAVVGQEPGALALAADGSRLYVSLTGSQELLGLSLPGMTPLGRVAMPATSFAIPASVASALAVSPTDPTAVAAAVWNGTNNDAATVVLVRNFVADPRQGPRMSGRSLVAFAADGRTVFASDGTSLQALTVVADGLQASGEPLPLNQRAGTTLEATPDGLVLGPHLYAGSPVAWQGSYPLSRDACVSLSGQARVICLADDFGLRLVVSDRAKRRVLYMPMWADTLPSLTVTGIVAGVPGQVALRLEGNILGQAETLLLVDGALLRP